MRLQSHASKFKFGDEDLEQFLAAVGSTLEHLGVLGKSNSAKFQACGLHCFDVRTAPKS